MAVWKLAFQLSPIFLVGGLVQFMEGVMVPLIAITEALNFPAGLLSGGENLDLDDFVGNFETIPGTKLISYEFAKFPFANQNVAANAGIKKPLRVSLRMVTTAKGNLGYFLKFAIFTALQAAIDAHQQLGGSYLVLTPSGLYANCLLLDLTDVSSGTTKQPQNAWQWDFEQPLIALNDLSSAQSTLLSAISNALNITGQNPGWASVGAAGTSTLGGAGPALVPSLGTTGASGISTLPQVTAGGPLQGGGV